jgi:hypothetical protein
MKNETAKIAAAARAIIAPVVIITRGCIPSSPDFRVPPDGYRQIVNFIKLEIYSQDISIFKLIKPIFSCSAGSASCPVNLIGLMICPRSCREFSVLKFL